MSFSYYSNVGVVSKEYVNYLDNLLRGVTGSALDHRSLPPEFDSRGAHI